MRLDRNDNVDVLDLALAPFVVRGARFYKLVGTGLCEGPVSYAHEEVSHFSAFGNKIPHILKILASEQTWYRVASVTDIHCSVVSSLREYA